MYFDNKTVVIIILILCIIFFYYRSKNSQKENFTLGIINPYSRCLFNKISPKEKWWNLTHRKPFYNYNYYVPINYEYY